MPHAVPDGTIELDRPHPIERQNGEAELRRDVSVSKGLGRVIMLNRGDTLFRTGNRARHVYYLAEGLLRAEHRGPDGWSEVLGYFDRGTTLGLTFMRVQPFTVTAVNPSCVIAYSAATLSKAVVKHPYAAARVAAFATKPLSEILGYLQVSQLADPAARLSAYILLEFDRRGLVEGEEEIVELRGNVEAWAALLDMTPDMVRAGFATLTELKILRRLGPTKMALLNRAELEKLAHRFA